MDTDCMMLNGTWELGTDRRYDRTATVPGLASDPGEMNEGPLWYRRSVSLPWGSWTHATLHLLGARFCPSVYVNGDLVSESPGGMTWTRHQLRHPAVQPGATIAIEIALKSLRDVDEGDASRIPEADWWRSNVSSCLWDSVRLRLHGPAWISRVIPYNELLRNCVTVSWELEDIRPSSPSKSLDIEIIDKDGAILAVGHVDDPPPAGQTDLALGGRCQLWSPEHPSCYRLQLTLRDERSVLDRECMTWGMREFSVRGKAFALNGQPVTLRAGTAVWHRWTRDPEARELAFDVGWFERNIVQRLKAHGANTLRFHLGMPPEAFLDLCDRNGLIVQVEWSFFHGLKGTQESLIGHGDIGSTFACAIRVSA